MCMFCLDTAARARRLFIDMYHWSIHMLLHEKAGTISTITIEIRIVIISVQRLVMDRRWMISQAEQHEEN